MDIFPKTTYVDLSQRYLASFKNNLCENLSAANARSNIITTGTTVIGLVSRDKKIGILASDGRVMGGTHPFQENFEKIFSCRIGFIGAAGMLGLIQNLTSSFRLSLNSICDSRKKQMTASGASKHLFLFYSSAVGKTPADVPIISLLSIFWDEEDRSCHLYKLDGGSRLSEDRYACIGSGGLFIEREAKKLQVGNSKEELFFQAKSLLLAAAEEDKATNERVFYGLIENGHFSTGEEVTR